MVAIACEMFRGFEWLKLIKVGIFFWKKSLEFRQNCLPSSFEDFRLFVFIFAEMHILTLDSYSQLILDLVSRTLSLSLSLTHTLTHALSLSIFIFISPSKHATSLSLSLSFSFSLTPSSKLSLFLPLTLYLSHLLSILPRKISRYIFITLCSQDNIFLSQKVFYNSLFSRQYVSLFVALSFSICLSLTLSFSQLLTFSFSEFFQFLSFYVSSSPSSAFSHLSLLLFLLFLGYLSLAFLTFVYTLLPQNRQEQTDRLLTHKNT